MSGALIVNWGSTELGQICLFISSQIANALVWVPLTVATQYVVASWIWSSAMKKTDKFRVQGMMLPMVIGLFVVSLAYPLDLAIVLLTGKTATISSTTMNIGVPVVVFGGSLCYLPWAYIMHLVRSSNEAISLDAEGSTIAVEEGCGGSPDVRSGQENHQQLSSGDDLQASNAHAIVNRDVPSATPSSDLERESTNKSEREAQGTVETQKVVANKDQVHYINNIKIFLTFMVICHHCGVTLVHGENNFGFAITATGPGTVPVTSFNTINQSYFMSLFFFFSGYFVPTSFDRKGAYSFLYERVKRLGIPLVVYTFVLGPYVGPTLAKWMMIGAFNPWPIANGPVNPGVTWFLAQLLIFSGAYAFVCGKGWHPEVPFPGISRLILIGLGVGIIQVVISLFLTGNAFWFFTPLFWQYYIMYIFAFFGGALARRNAWMDDIKNMSVAQRTTVYCLCLLILVGIVVIFSLSDSLAAMDPTLVFIVQQILTPFLFGAGIPTVVWCLGVTLFFMDFVNRSYFCTKFFTDAMYTAYIIQFIFPLPLGLVLITRVLNALGEDIHFTEEDRLGHISNDALAFPCFLLYSAIANLVAWPLAYGIRSIPGFSKVL